jgi:hypothetical protein
MSDASDRPTLSVPVSEQRDHIHGPVTAAVTLVEYGTSVHTAAKLIRC